MSHTVSEGRGAVPAAWELAAGSLFFWDAFYEEFPTKHHKAGEDWSLSGPFGPGTPNHWGIPRVPWVPSGTRSVFRVRAENEDNFVKLVSWYDNEWGLDAQTESWTL